jgi:hypothetical protein
MSRKRAVRVPSGARKAGARVHSAVNMLSTISLLFMSLRGWGGVAESVTHQHAVKGDAHDAKARSHLRNTEHRTQQRRRYG